jgi:hypothetical protein
MAYLNGKRVKNDTIDPKKHKFIGTFRSPTVGNLQGHGIVLCPCGQMLHTYGGSFDHWQHGHFDEMMYEDIKTNKDDGS